MSKAAKQNPALQPFEVLVGKWLTVGKHPMLPDTILNGRVSFKWIEKGAFLVMRSHINHKDFPDGIAIFGSDDTRKECSMIYFDERTVSRHYVSTLKNNVWKWWRDDKLFSQRCTAKIKDNGNTIVLKGEMRRKGKTWEKDLELVYTRVKS